MSQLSNKLHHRMQETREVTLLGQVIKYIYINIKETTKPIFSRQRPPPNLRVLSFLSIVAYHNVTKNHLNCTCTFPTGKQSIECLPGIPKPANKELDRFLSTP